MSLRAHAFLQGSRRGLAFLLLGGAFAACGGMTLENQSTATSSTTGAGSTTGTGGTGGMMSTSTATSSSSASNTSGNGGSGGFITSAMAGTGGGMPVCNPGPDEDKDGDGFTVTQGDCNDCDPGTNPGAVEIIVTDPLPGGGGVPVPVDENCDGLVDNVLPFCDTGLALDDADPVDAARAIDLCMFSTGPKSWGLVSAAWVLADGAPLPSDPTELAKYHLGHGILGAFGPNNPAKAGASLLVLSSGTARRPTDPGYQSVAGFDKGFPSGAPPGFPLDSPSCPGVLSGGARDAVALEVQVRAPTNASGFRFSSSVFSRSWPDRVCSVFDDAFVVLQAPAPQGAVFGNITFDMHNSPVTLNLMSLDACSCAAPPCFAPPSGPTQKPYDCAMGPAALAGTGFDAYAGTGWLLTSAPVKHGEQFSLRFAVWDGEDGLFDTTVLVDSFQWITEPGP